MQRDARTFLRHILEAANDIVEFLGNVDFATYRKDKVLRAAIERKFEVIGEATKLLSEAAPDVANRIQQRPTLIAFRNVLIHGYSVVNDERVFLAAKEPLMELRRNIEAILADLDRA